MYDPLRPDASAWLPGDDDDPTLAPLRILVGEPDVETAALLTNILQGRGYEVEVAPTAACVLHMLAERWHDVVLLAWSLPGATGLEVLRRIRNRFALPDLPVVLMSTGDDSKSVVHAFDRGANDFLRKPLHPDVTLVRVHNLVALRRARLALQQQAMVDALTGVFNRGYMMQHLRAQIAQARRYGRDLAFCLCDIDHLKAVNDTYGHRTGDAALELVARLLRERLRRSDVVGRFGGDELCIIFPETSVASAAVAAEAVRRAIEGASIQCGNRRSCNITMSFGVAGLDEVTRDVTALSSRADEALYMAKQRGRNRTCTTLDLDSVSLVAARDVPRSA